MEDLLSQTVRRAISGSVVRQKTLQEEVRCTGVSLHGGASVALRLTPAAADSGIVFRRIDADDAEIEARFENVVDTRLCMKIQNADGVSVATIEHLMAALAACEVDNVVVELDGDEVPVMDGSAEPFVRLIESVGVAEQEAPRRAIRVLRPITVRDGAKFLSIEPAEVAVMGLEIEFDAARIGCQSKTVELSGPAIRGELAAARTFGFLHEVEAMHQAGLARGGSLDNAVVIDGNDVMNEDGLRFEDEFVRHKLLDCVGDLYLAGGPIIGAISGSRVGHALNNALLEALFADETAWTWATIEDAAVPTIAPAWEGDAAAATA